MKIRDGIKYPLFTEKRIELLQNRIINIARSSFFITAVNIIELIQFINLNIKINPLGFRLGTN